MWGDFIPNYFQTKTSLNAEQTRDADIEQARTDFDPENQYLQPQLLDSPLLLGKDLGDGPLTRGTLPGAREQIFASTPVNPPKPPEITTDETGLGGPDTVANLVAPPESLSDLRELELIARAKHMGDAPPKPSDTDFDAQGREDFWARMLEFSGTLGSTPGSFGEGISAGFKGIAPGVAADIKARRVAEDAEKGRTYQHLRDEYMQRGLDYNAASEAARNEMDARTDVAQFGVTSDLQRQQIGATMAVGLQPTDFEKQLDVLRGTPGITEEAIGEALLSRLGGTSQEAALANVTAILQAHGTGFLAPEQADMLLAAAYAQLWS